MHPRQFALISGIFMLLFGVAALLPSLSTAPADAGLPILNLETSYGHFLGFFPMNIINKLVLIAFGVAGIYCANLPNTSLPASIKFSRWVFAVMGVAAILGLLPATNTLNGYWPLFGGEVVMHAVLALLGGYFGFVLSSRAMEENHRRFPEDQRRAS
jgi:hypothetical protein